MIKKFLLNSYKKLKRKKHNQDDKNQDNMDKHFVVIQHPIRYQFNNQEQSHFLNLPPEVLMMIGSYLLNQKSLNLKKDLARLSFTNLALYWLYKEMVDSIRKVPKIGDFELLIKVGSGNFCNVYLAKEKATCQQVAIKIYNKVKMNKDMPRMLTMIDILKKIDHPLAVVTYYSFQDDTNLYLATKFFGGGELYYYLKMKGRLSFVECRFIFIELVSVVSYIHELDVIIRGIKPEDVVFDTEGHVHLVDYNLSKLFLNGETRTNSFCGTPEYLAPEVLEGKYYTKKVDYWALGNLLYECIVGLPPFYNDNIQTMYSQVLSNPIAFPNYFNEEAKPIITGLMEKDPEKRYGIKEIKEDGWMQGIDWELVKNKGLIPPKIDLSPNETQYGAYNIDSVFLNEPISENLDSPQTIGDPNNYPTFDYLFAKE